METHEMLSYENLLYIEGPMPAVKTNEEGEEEKSMGDALADEGLF